MSSNRTLWTVVAVTAVVAALLGGGAVWASQRRAATDARAKSAAASASAKAQADRIATLEANASSATAAAAVAPTSAPAPSPIATPTVKPAPAPIKAPRQFAFVTKASLSGAKASLTADYAQYLTGAAAAAAASKHGDESPPPNDYYVVNDNPALRKLPVKAGISVKLVSKPDGTVEVGGYTVPLAKWVGYYTSPSATTAGITGAWYWLTVKSGVVIAIAEQYVP